MGKLIYDIIQRFEVENGIPCLISTNIHIVEGGQDLVSLSNSILAKLSFYEKFKVNRASQYRGYRLKSPKPGFKRYQLVLAERKEGLCISIPQDIFQPEVLKLIFTDNTQDECIVGIFWVLPSKKQEFIQSLKPNYPHLQISGDFYINPVEEFSPYTLSDSDSYLVLSEDKLFPYTWQVCISSGEVLEEFLGHFGKILMEIG